MKRGILAAACLFLSASWLFPYYVYYSRTGHRLGDSGFGFLFGYQSQSLRIDFGRLFLTDLTIVAATFAILRIGAKREESVVAKLRKEIAILNKENDEWCEMWEKLQKSGDVGRGKN